MRLDNYIYLILSDTPEIEDKSTIREIDLLQEIEEVIDQISVPIDEIRYYTIDSNLYDIDELCNGDITIEEILVLTQEIKDMDAYDTLLLQALIDNRDYLKIDSVSRLLHIHRVLNEIGVIIIPETEVFEFLYDNGINLEIDGVFQPDELKVANYLANAGILWYQTATYGGYVDVEVIYDIGGVM